MGIWGLDKFALVSAAHYRRLEVKGFSGSMAPEFRVCGLGIEGARFGA